MLVSHSLILFSFALAVGPVVGSAEDPGPAPGLAALNVERLMQHVQTLAGPELHGRGVGQPGNEAAVAYIEGQFRQAGLAPLSEEAGYRHSVVVSSFRGEKVQFPNVVGFLEGRDEELRDEVIVIGAHLDHLGTHPSGQTFWGADDNASGTSVLMEVARSFARYGPRPKRSICFVAFNGEEGNFSDGTRPRFSSLAGSREFAENPPLRRGRIVGMINMDMVGRYLFDDLLALPSVAVVHSSPDPFANAVERAKKGVRLGVHRTPIGYLTWTNDALRSDHAHFHLSGLPVLWLSTSLHRDYHQPTDRVEKVRPMQLVRIARFVFLTAGAAADSPPETFPARARR